MQFLKISLKSSWFGSLSLNQADVNGIKQMRILIITGIFPPDIGGPATYVPLIAQALVERGHQVRVITLSDAEPTCGADRLFPVTRIARSQWYPLRWLRTVGEIIRHGRSADVLFVNGLALESVMANCLLRKPLLQKIVGDLAWERARTAGATTDTLELFQRTAYGPRVELLKKLRSFWSRSSTMLIAPSNYLKNIITGWGIPAAKIQVIYNAVQAPEPAAALPAVLRQLTIPSRVIVSVGRLVPWKGFEDLIMVAGALPDAQLCIIGEGPGRGELERLIREQNLSTRVHLIGACSRGEVFAYLRHADLFVLNSRYEGLPHIVLEAMSAGVPVVATDTGGTGELVRHEHNGLLVPPGDRAMLDRAVRLVLGDRSLGERLAGNGRATLEKFNWAGLVDQTESLLAAAGGKTTAADAARAPSPRELSALFLSTARFSLPPDRTLEKKWSGLQRFFDATVVSLWDAKGFSRQMLAGSRWILLPAGPHRSVTYALYFFCALWFCLQAALRSKQQVIVAQSPFQALAPALALLPWRLARARSRPRLIVEIHNDWTEGVMLYHPSRFSRLEQACRLVLGRFALSQADACRVISAYCRTLLPRSTKPVYVFPTFTDLDSFAAPAAALVTEMARAYGTGFFISAGMLIPLKGLHHLIRAFAAVAGKHPAARLIIAGQGKEEHNLRQLTRDCGLSDHVSFVGHLEQSVLAALIKNAIAFVLPSLTEGLGRVAIEAQLLGKPVIASRVGGIPEIITDGITGLLTAPGDEQALSRAMLDLLEQPQAAEKMGQAGQQAVLQKFNYATYYQSYYDMLKKTCSA